MKMSDKIQFTGEQAQKFCIEMGIENVLAAMMKMKELDYIRKSDLEILIEEAESMFTEKYNKNTQTFCEVKQHDCIQAMKAELNKRKDK
jgi:hypothetical protein